MLKPEHATPTHKERVEKTRLVDMNFKLDIGHVLLACGFAVSIVVYLVSDHNSINHLTDNFATFQTHTDKRFDKMQESIDNLPVDRTKAMQETQTVSELKQKVDAVSSKVDDVKQTTNDRITNLQQAFVEKLNEIQLKGIRQPR
jgi:hypothetical protein